MWRDSGAEADEVVLVLLPELLPLLLLVLRGGAWPAMRHVAAVCDRLVGCSGQRSASEIGTRAAAAVASYCLVRGPPRASVVLSDGLSLVLSIDATELAATRASRSYADSAANIAWRTHIRAA